MKRIFTHFLPVIAIATVSLYGCMGKSDNPIPYPSGTFEGQFRLLHRSPGSTKIDTAKANIELVLETGVGFKVLGDTSTVHAGSKGQYAINSASVIFQDTTYPKTGKPTKAHLSGTFLYSYDGSNVLQMVASSADTLSYQYDLKRK